MCQLVSLLFPLDFCGLFPPCKLYHTEVEMLVLLLFTAYAQTVLHITDPSATVSSASISLSHWQRLFTPGADYCFAVWVRDNDIEDLEMLSLETRGEVLEPVLSLWKKHKGYSELHVWNRLGELLKVNFPLSHFPDWQQLAIIVSNGGHTVTLCNRHVGLELHCFDTVRINRAVKAITDSAIELLRDNRQSAVTAMDAKCVISDSADFDFIGYFSENEACGISGRCLGNVALTGEFPQRVEKVQWHWKRKAESRVALSGWLYIKPTADDVVLGKIDIGERDVVTLHLSTDPGLQACIKSSGHVFCLSPLSVEWQKWTYVAVSFHRDSLQLCLGRLWQRFPQCVDADLRRSLYSVVDASDYQSAEFTAKCLQGLGLQLYLSTPYTSDSASLAIEQQEFLCISDCPMLHLVDICSSDIQYTRRTQAVHYSAITYQQFILMHEDQYYTFTNNHVSTVSILMIADNLGSTNNDPDIFIYKPWNGDPAAFDWSDTSWLTSGYTVLSTNPLLPSKGGIKGLYTFRVYGWNGPFTYEARVRIKCNSGNPALCNCAAGQYSDSTLPSCTSCPSGDIICPLATDVGCLPYSSTTSQLAGAFNCQNCLTTATWLQAATGNCVACHTECASCWSGAANQCFSCYSNASLIGTLGYGTCVCNPGYYGSPNSSNCIVCDPHCTTCSGGLASSCTGCQVNAQLSGTAPSSCVCVPGYYGDSANCLLCDNTCKTCTAGGAASCSSCLTLAQLSTSPGPSPCICVSSAYHYPIQGLCYPCDLTCQECTSSSYLDCTQCHSNAFLSNPPTSNCKCDPGYFMNLSTGQCQLCDVTCAECVGAGQANCQSCHSFAALSSDSRCKCIRAYPNPHSGKCAQCDLSCDSCIDGSADSCTSCLNGAQLYAASPSSCICSTGFYPAPTASNCLPCDATCLTCQDAAVCLTCKPYAQLIGTFCECQERTSAYPDASNCVPCPSRCIHCFPGLCQQCESGLLIFNGECIDACPAGYEANAASTCEESRSVVPSLVVTESNNLIVHFSEDMETLSLAESDIDVQAVDTDQNQIPVAWTEPEAEGSQTLNIKLTFDVADIAAGSVVTFTFLSPSALISITGESLAVTTLTGDLHVQSIPQVAESVLQTPTGSSTTQAASGGTVAGASMSILCGNVGILVSLVNSMQLITYIAMTKIDLPTELAATLSALNMGFMLSSPFSARMPQGNSENRPPDHVVNYGIDTFLFLQNAMTVLGTAVGVLLSYIPIYLLSKVESRFISTYFKSLLPSLLWDTPMKLWLTAYLDIGVFSFLQVSSAYSSLSSFLECLNLLCGVFFALWVLATPFLIWSFLTRNSVLLATAADQRFARRWGTLTAEFKPGGKATNVGFYLIFTMRRLSFALSLVVTQNVPGFVTLFNTCLSLSVIDTQSLLYLALSRPYVHYLDQLSAVLNESSVLLVYISVTAFAFGCTGLTADIFSGIGVWAARVALLVNIVLSVIKTILHVAELLKSYKKAINTHVQMRTAKTFSIPERFHPRN